MKKIIYNSTIEEIFDNMSIEELEEILEEL
jgi:hypothetical protein